VITSTILNLVVLPTLALQYGRFEPTEPIPIEATHATVRDGPRARRR